MYFCTLCHHHSAQNIKEMAAPYHAMTSLPLANRPCIVTHSVANLSINMKLKRSLQLIHLIQRMNPLKNEK